MQGDVATVLLQWMFWSSTALVAYVYAVYPLLIWLCSQLCGNELPPPAQLDDHLPSLTVLIAAHNEQEVIAERIENALGLDYPRGRLDVVIVSDGSTDRTADIVRSYAHRGVRLLELQPNRGKAAAINTAFDHLSSEIVLLSDANTWLDPLAARRLARWFARPEVGVVCGRLHLVDSQGGRNADGIYWRYENFMKRQESRLGALVGANGAIYALRRESFVALPAGTISDDLLIPLLARRMTGCSLVYDASATAVEGTAPTIADEFRRRVRISAGAFQSLALVAPLLHPRHGWLAFSLLSHKVLRWFCPFFLLMSVIASLSLLDEQLYRDVALLQAGVALVSLIGIRLPGRGFAVRLARLTSMFTCMNLALFIGFLRWLRGRGVATWTPSARTPALAKPPQVLSAR